MNDNMCEYCMNLDQDMETGEVYCTVNIDQDDLARMQYSKYASCPYFRRGDDYTIVKKQM